MPRRRPITPTRLANYARKSRTTPPSLPSPAAGVRFAFATARTFSGKGVEDAVVALVTAPDRPERIFGLVTGIARAAIGEDERPSEMLEAMIKHLGADEDDVELAQDIADLSIGISEDVVDEAIKGSLDGLVGKLAIRIGMAIPELKLNIQRVRS